MPRPGVRATFGFGLSLGLGVLLWWLPLPLPVSAHHLLAIFVPVVVLWISEALPIPVTALLIAPAMIITGITDASTAFAPYADPLLFLFVGGFFIARAMSRHGLDQRLARALVSLPMIRGVPARMRFAMMVAGLTLSMWISNTATAAILLPIVMGTAGRGGELDGVGAPHRSPSMSGNLLCIAYGSSVGGLGTLVGSPPNLITLRFLRGEGVNFAFFDWMLIGLPAAVAMLLVIYALFQRLAPPGSPAPQAPDATSSSPAPLGPSGPWSRGEIVTACSFGLAVAGWMLPGILKAVESPLADPIGKALPGGAVAIMASSILFAIPAGRPEERELGEKVLPWRDAVQIDWGLILLFGGGITLGTQMFESGLAEALAGGFVAATGVSDLWTLTAIVIVFTIFFTETCSNTATANMLAPLVIAAAKGLGVSIIPPALGVGLAASCAFMLPIATGPNALVYGTGQVTMGEMMRAGIWLNLIGAGVIFLLLRLLCPALGWV